MGKKTKHYYGVGSYYDNLNKKTLEDTTSDSHYGFLYLKSDTMQEFTKASGPLARNNEYQCHYSALVARVKYQNLFFDVAFPTSMYNYDQIVSTAAIEFKLKDVTDMHNAVSELHGQQMTKFSSIIKDDFSALFGPDFEIEWMESHFNNIHRHPGGISQRFSGTDEDNNLENPGILFPLSSGNNTPIFSSIIAHVGKTKVAHSEYRICNGTNVEDENGDCTLSYAKGKSVVYVEGTPNTANPLASIFGFSNEEEAYLVNDGMSTENQLTKRILDFFASLKDKDMSPETIGIDAEFVKNRAVVKHTKTTKTYGPKWNAKLGKWDYGQDIEDEFENTIDEAIETAKKSKMNNKKTKAKLQIVNTVDKTKNK